MGKFTLRSPQDSDDNIKTDTGAGGADAAQGRSDDAERRDESVDAFTKAVRSSITRRSNIDDTVKALQDAIAAQSSDMPGAEVANREPAKSERLRTDMQQAETLPAEETPAQEEDTPQKRVSRKRGRSREMAAFSRKDALITSFFIPVLILVIICVAREIYPFGDNAMLRTDMYHQYAPFFSELRNKLTNGGSLAYTWDIGLGVNFAAIFAYYLASPLNLLLFFCPQEHVLEFMALGIILRIGLSGLSMCSYMLPHVKSNNMIAAFAGIFYALSGYISAYYWNIMWLDCIALFPLICLGVEKLIDEKNGVLYVIALALCIWTNYYISMMVCVFMVIYFAMMLIMRSHMSLRQMLGAAMRFGCCSLLAGGLAAVVILPGVMTLRSTAAATTTFPQTVQHYFSCIDMIARHMMFVKNEEGLDHWPNVYCGVAVIPLVCMWLRARNISLKEKLVYGLTMLFFLSSFALNVLNYMWHGFHYPNSLPARMSFIYIFLVIFAAARCLDELDDIPTDIVNGSFAAALIFVALCQKTVTDDAFTWDVFYISAAFIAVYWIIAALHRNAKVGRSVITLITMTVVAVEAALNMDSTSISTVKRTTYLADNAYVRDVVAYAYDNDRDFYRFDKVTRKTKDDGAWMNFHSVSIFSSVTDAGISDFFKHVGCESSVNAYSITGATPFVDALLDVKYAIYSEPAQDPHEKITDQSGDIFLYRNPYTLPLGFAVSQDVLDNWSVDTGNPIYVQNDICDVCGIEGDMLVQAEGTREGNTFKATVPQDGLYYAYSDSTATKSITSRIDDVTKTYSNINRGYLMELGYLKAGTDIELTATEDSTINARLYRFNYDTLEKVTEYLGRYPLTISSYDDTHIEGTVEATEKEGILFTTIPYESGWSAYVDGEKVDTMEIYESFLAVKLTAGTHSIRFEYEPEGLKLGMYISFGSLAVSAAACAALLYRRRRVGKRYAE